MMKSLLSKFFKNDLSTYSKAINLIEQSNHYIQQVTDSEIIAKGKEIRKDTSKKKLLDDVVIITSLTAAEWQKIPEHLNGTFYKVLKIFTERDCWRILIESEERLGICCECIININLDGVISLYTTDLFSAGKLKSYSGAITDFLNKPSLFSLENDNVKSAELNC